MLRYRVSLRQALTGANAAFDSADWSVYWQGTETDQDTYEVRRAVPPRTPPVQLDRAFDYDESMFGFEFTAVKSMEPARSCTTSCTASRRRVPNSRNCGTGCRPT